MSTEVKVELPSGNLVKTERPWNEGGEEKPFSVTLWDTHPDKEEDTCCTGIDFATLEEAEDCYQNIEKHFSYGAPGGMRYWTNTPYVMLDGPNVHKVRKRPGIKEYNSSQDDEMARREYAMQQGMGLGIDAYNEAMGWDSE